MTRCLVILSTLVLVASIGLSQEERLPNIVYIMCDELGYYELEHMGSPHLKTPNIDKMAKQGLRFTNALAAAPVCAPVRASLMTGKHTGHSSVRLNDGGTPLRADEITIASLLKEKGYATGGFGKWGAGGRGSTGVPEKHGFDEFFGFYDQTHAHSYYPPYLIKNSEEVLLPGNNGGAAGKTYAHYEIMDAGLKFIRQNKDKPFFAYFPITPPHRLFSIPADDPAWKRYQDAEWMKDATPAAKNYAAMVSMVDNNVGTIIDLLEELGLAEDTVVFFTGDNGGSDLFKSEDNPRGFFAPNVDPTKTNDAFRGEKGSLYEGGLRIPFIVKWPNIIEQARVSDHVFAQYDVLSTIAELVGIDDPEGTDGLSILPEIVGEIDSQEQHEFLYWEFNQQKAVRMGDWKAIRTKKQTNWELYDLSKDIGETKSVAAEFPKVLAKLQAFAKSSHTPAEPGTYSDPARVLHKKDKRAKMGLDAVAVEEASVPAAKPVLSHISLLNLDAWQANPAWADEDNSTVVFNKNAKARDLISKDSYGNTRVRFEYKIPEGSNSGIYFQNRYEVQILDSYGKKDRDLSFSDNGGIYERWNKEAEAEKGFEGTAPQSNQSRPPGQWQSFDITFKAPTFDQNGKKLTNAKFTSVIHNGVEIHSNVTVTGPTRGGAAGPEVAEAPFRIQGDHGLISIRKFEIVSKELATKEAAAFAAKFRKFESQIESELANSTLEDRQRQLVKSMTVEAYRRSQMKSLWVPTITPQQIQSSMEGLLQTHGFPLEESILSFSQDPLLLDASENSDILITLMVSETCLRLKQGPKSDPEWPNWAYGDKPYSTNSYKYFNTIPARFASVATRSKSPVYVVNDFVPKNWVYQALLQQVKLSNSAPIPPQLEVSGLIKIGYEFDQAKELADYLFQLGYMTNEALAATEATYTEAMSQGVKSFQQSKGLQADGILGPNTAKSISTVSLWEKQTLTTNLHRARRLADDMGKRYLLANLPSAEVYGMDNDAESLRMRIVFGKNLLGQRTPLFHDKMEKVVFRPYWNVPHSIAVKEDNYSNIEYLTNNNFEIVSHSNTQVVDMTVENLNLVQSQHCYIRQNGGDNNALGLVKFLFPNSHAVYFHDTPFKHFFKNDYRARSHGCVRLAEPEAMANWILKDYPEWDADKINAAIYEGEREIVYLDEHIPVYLTYFTAFPDPKDTNAVVFLNDYYEYDKEDVIIDDPAPPPVPRIIATAEPVEEQPTVERTGGIFSRMRSKKTNNQATPQRKGLFRRMRPKR